MKYCRRCVKNDLRALGLGPERTVTMRSVVLEGCDLTLDGQW
jgi:hypothetical protein